MNVKVDKEKCIGCGACEAVIPEIFQLKDGKAVVLKQPKGKVEEQKSKEAADVCPVQAISVK